MTQSDPKGREFRLVILAVSGVNNAIEDNSFGGGAGQVGDEMSYDAGSGQFTGINDPEGDRRAEHYGGVPIQKGGRRRYRPDGRLLVITGLRAGAAPALTGPGMVVSILSGVNADGSANMAVAGTWYPIAQQASLSGGTIELLLQDPLPAAPAPAGYPRHRDHGRVPEQHDRGQHARPGRQVLNRHRARRRGLRDDDRRQQLHRRDDLRQRLQRGGDLYRRGDRLGGQPGRTWRSRCRRDGPRCQTRARSSRTTRSRRVGGIEVGYAGALRQLLVVAGRQHELDRSRLRVGGDHRQHVRVRCRLPPGLGHSIRRAGQ